MFIVLPAAIQVGVHVTMGRNVQVSIQRRLLLRFGLGREAYLDQCSEVKAQAWANIQKNCNFQEELYVFPTLNQSGPPRAE